ncbi:hypothetical protein ACO0K9_26175 [Undibacterium sp. Ji50W]
MNTNEDNNRRKGAVHMVHPTGRGNFFGYRYPHSKKQNDAKLDAVVTNDS